MKHLKLAQLVKKIPFYIFVILILPITFNFAFPMIVEINHSHYEMMDELGEVAMMNYLMETLELDVWDLTDYDVSEQLWQIQVIQIMLVVMQQFISTIFVVLVLAMSIFYLTRRRIKFGNLFRYAVIGMLVSGFIVLLTKQTSLVVFVGSLLVAASITGLLSYSELKMAIIKDYFGEENINNGVY